MHPTKNDLPVGARKKLTDLLNLQLAAALDLGLQAKQAHWNVKGPHFIALHELFDKVAEAVEEGIDEIAERCVALGGQAEGSVQAIVKASPLKAYSLSTSAGRDHVKALSSAVADYGKGLRKAIDASAALGDADTADLFTGISRDMDKYLWFLEAHLEG